MMPERLKASFLQTLARVTRCKNAGSDRRRIVVIRLSGRMLWKAK